MKSKHAIPLLCAGVAVLVASLAGCGAAQAEPLEVTYYYLPG